jgi:hypothetical protein
VTLTETERQRDRETETAHAACGELLSNAQDSESIRAPFPMLLALPYAVLGGRAATTRKWSWLNGGIYLPWGPAARAIDASTEM